MLTQEQSLESTKKEWENPFYSEVKKTVSPIISTYIDIGANLGYGVRFFADLPNLKRVIAFEPDAHNFNVLLDTYPVVRGLDVRYVAQAIFYTDKLSMDVYGTGDGNTGGYMLAEIDDIAKPSCFIQYENKQFQITQLESYLKYLDLKATLVKIDVEGSEVNILKHSVGLPNIGFIMIEFHNMFYNECIALLEQYLPKHEILAQYDNKHFFLGLKANANISVRPA